MPRPGLRPGGAAADPLRRALDHREGHEHRRAPDLSHTAAISTGCATTTSSAATARATGCTSIRSRSTRWGRRCHFEMPTNRTQRPRVRKRSQRMLNKGGSHESFACNCCRCLRLGVCQWVGCCSDSEEASKDLRAGLPRAPRRREPECIFDVHEHLPGELREASSSLIVVYRSCVLRRSLHLTSPGIRAFAPVSDGLCGRGGHHRCGATEFDNLP